MKRILSIDGGGIKGVFPASFLATIEDAIGDRVSNYFDLIVGTSTGGIIALGLGLGWPASDLLNFYKKYGPSIFKTIPYFHHIAWLTRAKYNPSPLHSALEEKMGDLKLGHSTNRLVIPSVALETGEVHLFKTAHHPRFERDYKCSAISVARSTTAAPTYFPSYISKEGAPFVDGGVWANNPIAVAAIEAVTILDWPATETSVLSIGCTGEPLDANHARRRGLGRVYWGFKVVELFMATQSSAAHGMVQHLLGKDNVLRINPIMPQGRFKLDAVAEIDNLAGLGDSEARKALPTLRERFFQDKAETFVPEHSL